MQPNSCLNNLAETPSKIIIESVSCKWTIHRKISAQKNDPCPVVLLLGTTTLVLYSRFLHFTITNERLIFIRCFVILRLTSTESLKRCVWEDCISFLKRVGSNNSFHNVTVRTTRICRFLHCKPMRCRAGSRWVFGSCNQINIEFTK